MADEVLSLSFTMQLVKIPVNIDGQIYTLCEMSTPDQEAWMRKERLLGKGKKDDERIDGMRARFVAECLYDSTGKRVTEAEIMDKDKPWPAKMVQTLFNEGQKLCGLGQTTQDVKND